jgi:hypothetical protein
MVNLTRRIVLAVVVLGLMAGMVGRAEADQILTYTYSTTLKSLGTDTAGLNGATAIFTASFGFAFFRANELKSNRLHLNLIGRASIFY